MKSKININILSNYSGKINDLVFCKNGRVRIRKTIKKRKVGIKNGISK